MTTSDITISLAPVDQAIERLAQLDSSPCPDGPLLVAAVDGEPVAALTLDGRTVIADPFRPTAALVSLLEVRRSQISNVTRRAERDTSIVRRFAREVLPRSL